MYNRAITQLVLILSILLASNATGQVSHDELIHNFQSFLRLETSYDDATEHLATIEDDGSWADLDYSVEGGSWPPMFHLRRIEAFSLAYIDPNSSFFGDEDLYEAITAGLDFYETIYPYNDNWWVREIQVPRILGRILIIMRAGNPQLPQELESRIIARMDNIQPPAKNLTGANKIDISLWRVYKGLLKDSESEIQAAVSDAYSAFEVSTKMDAIQHDYSFFQHGQMFLTMHYGQVLLNTLNYIAYPLIGSPYEFKGHPYFDEYTNFLLGSYATVRRGQFVSFSSVGRQIVGVNSVKPGQGAYKYAKYIDSDHAEAYQDIIDRATGAAPPTTEGSYHKYYYRALFTSHSRPEYKFTILANNTRTKKTESGNGQNIKGIFLSEGANNILVNGNEYHDIFPVWEWNKIPGTTTPEYTGPKLRPRKDWGYDGKSTFAGGVSDGNYGSQVFEMNEYDTRAKKAWFMFDDEIVALGSGITSSAEETINTTVNQALLDGNVKVSENGNTSILSSQEEFHYADGLDWILHDSVGYFFPNKGNLKLSNSNQSGSISKIKTGGSTDILTEGVFKLWFDHGKTPENDSYAYIITPGKLTASEMQSYNKNNITILENSTDIQAVKHEALDMIQVVFHTAKTADFNGIKVGVDKPSMLVLKNISTPEVDVYIADPAENNSEIQVVLQSEHITPFRKIKAELPTTTAYKGSTVQYTINTETPKGSLVSYGSIKTFELMPNSDDKFDRAKNLPFPLINSVGVQSRSKADDEFNGIPTCTEEPEINQFVFAVANEIKPSRLLSSAIKSKKSICENRQKSENKTLLNLTLRKYTTSN